MLSAIKQPNILTISPGDILHRLVLHLDRFKYCLLSTRLYFVKCL